MKNCFILPFVISTLLLVNSVVASAQGGAQIGANESGDGLIISNGEKTLDLGGLMGGSLKVRNPNTGKSVSFGEDGSIDLKNNNRKGKVKFNDDGSITSSNTEKSVTTSGSVYKGSGNSLNIVSGEESLNISGNWRNSQEGRYKDLSIESTMDELNAKKTNKGIEIDLSSDILFDFDSSQIKDEAETSLAKVAHLIRKKSEGKVYIYGHTDSKGNNTYNQDLSEQRALSVMKFLRDEENIPAEILKGKGFGEDKPKAHNTNPDGSDDPEGRAVNRRVEIILETN